MKLRILIAVILSIILAGVCFATAKPAQVRDMQAKSTAAVKELPHTMDQAQTGAKVWYKQGHNWLWVAGGGAALIFAMALTLGGNGGGKAPKPSKDPKKKKDKE